VGHQGYDNCHRGYVTAAVVDPAPRPFAQTWYAVQNISTQITTTAQDSSFNGINLLNGDDLS